MRRFSFLLLAILCLPATLLAQKGDRKGHEKMDSFVPEDEIPPAPVLQVNDALKTFQVAPGFAIEAVVAEPLIEKPVALKFDGDGRMWVCEMRGYMPDIDGKGEEIPQGRIVILEDTDNDGAVDKRTVFLDKILLPRAVYLLDDGILYADQSNLYFIARDGDKPSGKPIVIDPDYAKGGNVEHKGNALLPGLDNWIYNSKSDRRYRKINGEWVMERTHFRGQWGLSQDDFGRLYHNNNSTLLVGDFLLPNTVFGNHGAKVKSSMSARIGSNAVWPIRVTPGVNRGYINKVNGYGSDTISSKTYKLINATGASGFAIYRGDQFPKKAYGTAFVTEPCGNLVKAISISDGDGKLTGDHPYGDKEFLASTDERFRPVDAVTAPDGSLYIIDFYHGIIQHKTYVTSYLRKQYISRGLDGPGYGLGRIYRVKAKDKPLGPAPKLQNLSAKELVPFLRHDNGWWRDTAQRLIVERGDASLQADLTTLLRTPSKPLGQLHALWCLEGLNILTPAHVEVLLNSGEEKLASSALAAARSLPDPFIPTALPSIIATNPERSPPSTRPASSPVSTPASLPRRSLNSSRNTTANLSAKQPSPDSRDAKQTSSPPTTITTNKRTSSNGSTTPPKRATIKFLPAPSKAITWPPSNAVRPPTKAKPAASPATDSMAKDSPTSDHHSTNPTGSPVTPPVSPASSSTASWVPSPSVVKNTPPSPPCPVSLKIPPSATKTSPTSPPTSAKTGTTVPLKSPKRP